MHAARTVGPSLTSGAAPSIGNEIRRKVASEQGFEYGVIYAGTPHEEAAVKHLLLLLLLTSLTLAASVNVAAADPASDNSRVVMHSALVDTPQSHRLIASGSDDLARSPGLPYVAD